VKKEVQFDFIKSIIKPSIAAIIMGILLYVLTHTIVHDFLSLIFSAGVSGIVYLTIYYFITKNELKQDIVKVFKKYEE
jgi:uncharacterized membrane-anchored protein